jgi:hypothetical protein
MASSTLAPVRRLVTVFWFRAILVCTINDLLVAAAPVQGAETRIEIGTAASHGGAPRWDARGLGPLPWQGVSCLDMSDDGRAIAVGTIAPQGDPNLLQLDAAGKIVGQHVAGQRWVNEVTVSNDGRFVGGLSTTPEGTSGDVPRLYGFIQGKELSQIGEGFSLKDFRPEWCLWQYGEHSNHLPRISCWAGNRWVVAGDQDVCWMSPGDSSTVERAPIGPGLTTAMAASPSGVAVVGRFAVGFYYTPGEAAQHAGELATIVGDRVGGSRRPAFQNLVVVKADKQKPVVWSRPVSTDVAPSPAPEQGIYGPSVPPHEDSKFQAPLSVAIDRAGERIAVADYEGWQRVFHPRDGSQDIPFGVRFMPSRPTIHLYDVHGNVIRRIGPKMFSDALWCDLAFSLDGRTLIASPHNWTSRGLGGQPILPADENARTLYTCDIASGEIRETRFPDTISSVDSDAGGTIAVGCWNHKVYLLDKTGRLLPSLPDGIDVGAASLIRGSKCGKPRFVVATTSGVVSMFDGEGKRLWTTDLNQQVRPGDKPSLFYTSHPDGLIWGPNA